MPPPPSYSIAPSHTPYIILKTFFHYGELHTKSSEESEPRYSLASTVIKVGLIQFNHICYLSTPSNSPVVNILKEFLLILLLFLLFLLLPIPFSLSLLISTSPLFFPTLPFLFSLSFDFGSFCKWTWDHFWRRGLVGFPLSIQPFTYLFPFPKMFHSAMLGSAWFRAFLVQPLHKLNLSSIRVVWGWSEVAGSSHLQPFQGSAILTTTLEVLKAEKPQMSVTICLSASCL